MPMTIKIKELRLKRELTQRQVADAIKIVESNYRKLENNRVRSIPLHTIEVLCNVLDCTPNDIFEVINTNSLSNNSSSNDR